MTFFLAGILATPCLSSALFCTLTGGHSPHPWWEGGAIYHYPYSCDSGDRALASGMDVCHGAKWPQAASSIMYKTYGGAALRGTVAKRVALRAWRAAPHPPRTLLPPASHPYAPGGSAALAAWWALFEAGGLAGFSFYLPAASCSTDIPIHVSRGYHLSLVISVLQLHNFTRHCIYIPHYAPRRAARGRYHPIPHLSRHGVVHSLHTTPALTLFFMRFTGGNDIR